MNPRTSIRLLTWPLLAVLAGLAAFTAGAADTKTNTPATNAPPAEVPIPLSKFEQPSAAQPGRDPFFPMSSRITFATAPVPGKGNGKAGAAPSDIVLKSIVGMPGARVALINTTTFETGESSEIIVTGGVRVLVRCLEIRAESVLIDIGGEKRDLPLKQ